MEGGEDPCFIHQSIVNNQPGEKKEDKAREGKGKEWIGREGKGREGRGEVTGGKEESRRHVHCTPHAPAITPHPPLHPSYPNISVGSNRAAFRPSRYIVFPYSMHGHNSPMQHTPSAAHSDVFQSGAMSEFGCVDWPGRWWCVEEMLVGSVSGAMVVVAVRGGGEKVGGLGEGVLVLGVVAVVVVVVGAAGLEDREFGCCRPSRCAAPFPLLFSCNRPCPCPCRPTSSLTGA